MNNTCKPFNMKQIIDIGIVFENNKHCVFCLYDDFSGKCLGEFDSRQEAVALAHKYGFIFIEN